MTGPEMMMSNAIGLLAKALKLDPVKLQEQITEIHATISGIGRTGAALVALMLMANRRLHRIETHLGLSDIEPIPTEMRVIDYVEVSLPVVDHVPEVAR